MIVHGLNWSYNIGPQIHFFFSTLNTIKSHYYMIPLKSNHLLNQAVVKLILQYPVPSNYDTLDIPSNLQQMVNKAFYSLQEEIKLYLRFNKDCSTVYKNKMILNNVNNYMYLSGVNPNHFILRKLCDFYAWFDILENNEYVPLDHYVKNYFIHNNEKCLFDYHPEINKIFFWEHIKTVWHGIKSLFHFKSRDDYEPQFVDRNNEYVSVLEPVKTSQPTVIYHRDIPDLTMMKTYVKPYSCPYTPAALIKTVHHNIMQNRGTTYILDKDDNYIHEIIVVIETYRRTLANSWNYRGKFNTYIITVAILDNESLRLSSFEDVDESDETYQTQHLCKYSGSDKEFDDMIKIYTRSLYDVSKYGELIITLPYVDQLGQWVYGCYPT